ncbi:LCP family protein [Corynebacterium terpenotabidum]|uniref:LytR transcription regulator n=1 Tax=Corynebacterium terpenotabidum Y-11 TaxID=1200352 RepID=S4XE06_9CORY|nr:LCP family protein [Corynebacterium terpenotabidum]AGP29830.1 LytR transcription regulator [Corynebacterium terpenotabidum Y-11]
MTQPPSPGNGSDPYARDHLGRILRDRYGNPVVRRTGTSANPPNNSGGHQQGRHEQPAGPQYRRMADQQPQQPQYAQQPPQQQAPQQRPTSRPPQSASRPAPQRRQKRRRPRLRRIFGVLLLVLVVLIGGTAWWVDSSLNRIDALTSSDLGNTKGTNWLLVGSDSREGLSEEEGAEYSAGDLTEEGQRTDTIIVVHVPSFGGTPTMVSIPRDSYVSIPGYGMDKINAAFSYGGPQLLQQTIEQNTGLRIDHYMEIGFAGFAGIVDALGGVTLCPAEAIDDPMAGLNIQAGCQTMDGSTALGYVRTRYTSANGDLDRVERQREFLTAVIKKIGSFSTIINPFKALPLISSLTDAITVDNGDHVWHLAALGLGLVRGSEQQTVPVAGFEETDAGSVVVWDDAAAEELFSTMR